MLPGIYGTFRNVVADKTLLTSRSSALKSIRASIASHNSRQHIGRNGFRLASRPPECAAIACLWRGRWQAQATDLEQGLRNRRRYGVEWWKNYCFHGPTQPALFDVAQIR
jgi:hypothetical protein